jgi:hypothetical protein
MAEYDDLIEKGVAELAAFTLRPTPENDARLLRTIMQAVQLRSGRSDDMVYRDDFIDVVFDVTAATRSALKARLVERLPDKLGMDPEEVERVLDAQMATLMPREQIERILDAHLPPRSD